MKVATGKAVIVTDVVADTTPHPPDAAMVYVTVYVPAVLVDGVIVPVAASMISPAGEAE